MAFCGLTRAELKTEGWINADQKCTARCAGGVECSKFYSEHPATELGVNEITSNFAKMLEAKDAELQAKEDTIIEQREQITLLKYANEIESSVACSHVEIFNHSAFKLLFGPDVVFTGIDTVPDDLVNRIWNDVRLTEFVPNGTKEAPHQQFLEQLIRQILTKLVEKTNIPAKVRFCALPKLPTVTHKVPDLALFPVYDLTQTFRSAVVLGEVEGPRASYYAEGMGQAISYSARMLKSRINGKGREVVVFFCTALEINILRRRLSTTLQFVPEDKIYNTGVLPLWTIAPRQVDQPTDGFRALVRLLSAAPSALDPLLSVPVGPSRLSLAAGGVLERYENTYMVIGRGGFSTVYGATLGRDYVAIKVTSRELVLRETTVLKALNDAYPEHADPGCHFLRLHLQHGADPTALIMSPVGTPLLSVVLNDTLAEFGLDSKTVMNHIRTAAQALHAVKYVHLDCGRLSNYVIADGFVRMIDFGLSAVQGAERKGLVGVRSSAATVICNSEFSNEQWMAVSDLDTESLSYLYYCLEHAGNMPWAQSMKDAMTQQDMHTACEFRAEIIRKWDADQEGAAPTPEAVESHTEKAVAVPTAVADTEGKTKTGTANNTVTENKTNTSA